MATLVRTWLGLAAMGAGLIHLAIAAGAQPVLLLALAALGAAELAWGITALARSTVPLPRMALAGAMLPTVLWVGLLLAGAGNAHEAAHVAGLHTASAAPALGTDLPVGSMLAGSVLDLAVAAVLAVRLRRARPDSPGREPGVWTYLGGVVAGAGVVFALTSAALGGTAIGQSAMHSMGH
jgi:hypothetical protein